MGLDLIWGDTNLKCGSYSSVQKIRYELLVGLKYYLESFFPEKEELIDYLCSLLKEKDTIQYHKEDPRKNRKFGELFLDGFFPFIFHSDCDGFLTSYNAKQFLETWDIVEECIDSSLVKEKDGSFYLNDIFQKSIDLCEDIRFC